MANLTDTAYIVRKSFVWGGIGIVVMTILGFATVATIRSIQQNRAVPTPTPGVTFGPLPKIVTPNSLQYPTSFELLLIEGRPPETVQYGTVYLVRAKTPTLLSRKESQQFAEGLGFPGEPIQTDNTVYQYADQDTNSHLVMDIASKNFTLRRNFIDVGVLNTPITQTETEIRKQAQTFFTRLKTWHENLSQAGVTYWTFEGQSLRETTEISQAQLVRVDFFQPALGDFPVVTSRSDRSNVYIIFAPGDKAPRMVHEASFNYFPPDDQTMSTYPLITGLAAWEQLQAGGAFISSPVIIGTHAVVRRIYLAYYQSDNYQPYLQLMWMFEGDNGFVAMIRATDPAWVAP